MAAIVRKIENSARVDPREKCHRIKTDTRVLIEQQRHRWPASASTLAFMLIAPGPGKRQPPGFDCLG